MDISYNTVTQAIMHTRRKQAIRNHKGHIVRHFKGQLYLILDVAVHTETDEELVIYKALYGECNVWARPIDMFASEVPAGKENPMGQQYRMEMI